MGSTSIPLKNALLL